MTDFETEWMLAQRAGYFKDFEIASQTTYKSKKGVKHRMTIIEPKIDNKTDRNVA